GAARRPVSVVPRRGRERRREDEIAQVVQAHDEDAVGAHVSHKLAFRADDVSLSGGKDRRPRTAFRCAASDSAGRYGAWLARRSAADTPGCARADAIGSSVLD